MGKVRRKKSVAPPFFKRNYHYLLIALTTILSLGLMVFLFFSYEDFHAFYLFQDPIEAKAMLLLPEYMRHLCSYYVSLLFFHVFGYTPYWYYIIVIVLAIFSAFLLYKFLYIITKQKLPAFFATLLFSSGYYGLDSYTWNMTSGFETALSFIIILTILISIMYFVQKQKKIYYVIALLIYSIFGYYFRVKSFVTIVEIFFLFLFFSNSKNFLKKIAISVPFIAITGIIFWSNLTGGVNKYHISIIFSNILVNFLGTLINLFIPSDIIRFFYEVLFKNWLGNQVSIDQFDAVCGGFFIILLIFLGKYIFEKQRKYIRFFSMSIIIVFLYILLEFLAVVIEGGMQINTIESFEHALSPITVWSSFLMGLTLFLLFQKKKKLGVSILIFIVSLNIYLSVVRISTLINNKSAQLKQFYSYVTSQVPKVNEPSVFYFSYISPRPYDPFSSGNPLINKSTYLAGFYGTNFHKLLFADSFSDALMMLKTNNIPSDRMYYFYVTDKKIINLTKDIKKFFTDNTNHAITINNENAADINLPSYYPFSLMVNLSEEPDFSKIAIDEKNDKYNPYYKLLFRNRRENKTYTVSAIPTKPVAPGATADKVLDTDVNTFWTPYQWGENGASLLLDLHEMKTISHVAWEISRAFPWQQRSPTEYSIYVSKDSTTWEKVITKVKNKPLGPGDYFFDSFTPSEARYIKITITKTFGNYPPAVDEVEVFDGVFDGFNYDMYYQVESNPLLYISSPEMLQEIYNTLYKDNLKFSISQQIDDDTIWKDERKQEIPILNSGNQYKYIVYFPVDGYLLKKIRFSADGFPLLFHISDVSLQYTPLSVLLGQ